MNSKTGSAASTNSGSPASSKAGERSSGRGSNLVALGSAAVLAIYGAGYVRTKPAADRMAAESAASVRRRPPAPASDVPTNQPASAPVAAQATTVASDTTVHATPSTAVAVAAPPRVDTQKPVVDRVGKADSAVHVAATASAATASAATASAATASANASATADKHDATGPASPSTSSTAPTVTAVVAQNPPSSPPPVAEPMPAPATPAVVAPKTVYLDGVYQGRGTSRHGDIEATVEIKEGRIVAAVISQCLTRYSCSWVNHLLPQVVARQSAEVDYVSGATESASALYYAVLKALAQAK